MVAIGALSYEASRAVSRAAKFKPNSIAFPIGFNQAMADGVNFVASGADNSALTRTLLRTPKRSGVTDIVVGYPNAYLNNPETNFPFAFSFTASIEYPIGTTPQQLFTNAGGTLTIVPGRGVTAFDPWPGYIPPDTAFAVKTWISWSAGAGNFPLRTGAGGRQNEWFTKGVGLADATLDLVAKTPTYAVPTYDAGIGFPPQVTGRLKSPVASVAVIGDSIASGTYERVPDPTYGGVGWPSGLRGAIGLQNLSRQSMAFTHYRSRSETIARLVRDGTTHLICALGRNDLSAGTAASTIQTYLQDLIAPFLARGIACYATTLTPISSSTDTFATTANQTVASAPQETQRLAYNTWLRANWASIGLAGILDIAWAVDPTDSGKWGVDSGYIGRRGLGVATLGGGGIASVALPTYSAGTAYGGTQYPTSAGAHPCVVYPHPDDPVQSGGGVVTMATDAGGIGTSFSVTTAGLYTVPPLVVPQGRWTDDGTHPTVRGMYEILYRTGFGANRFVV